ncbi:MAG: histidine phosphatase family protein [Chloroflexi bacterium]|nr:histidine phosphatase family protein [Chloroflexota bacterium]
MSTSPRIFNPSPRTIYLVRHGETEGNLDDKAQGHFDASLTERGEIQAEAVAKRLSNIEFSAIYSSDLRRAFETAKAIAAHRPEVQIQTRPQLREYDFGDYEDVPWAKIGENDSEFFQMWKNLDTRERIEFPGGESLMNAWQRIGEVTDEILAIHQHGNEKILIVGHGGSLQGVMGHLLDLRIRDQWSFLFNNTSVTVLIEHLYTPNTWRTTQFNDTSHLNGIGLINRG